MADGTYNNLLKWSLENSEEGRKAGEGQAPATASRGLDPEALKQLLGGPSDADLMREAMTVIVAHEATLENKLVAWDNLEQMIENLDNANNMTQLGLWEPLLSKLHDEEAEVRTMACWCIGTAVQNNIKCQVKLLATGAIPAIIKIATSDPDKTVRRKAVMALSSEVRNYQPALDEAWKHLPPQYKTGDKADATDMETVDGIINAMRSDAAK